MIRLDGEIRDKTVIAMNSGEVRLFKFISDCEITAATYKIYKGESFFREGTLMISGCTLNLLLSELTAGNYWLYTTCSNNIQKFIDTWIINVS